MWAPTCDQLVLDLLNLFCFQHYGHRVRLATHTNFKEFVLTAGLEFYPLGGDPKVLAECMFVVLSFFNVWLINGLCIPVTNRLCLYRHGQE